MMNPTVPQNTQPQQQAAPNAVPANVGPQNQQQNPAQPQEQPNEADIHSALEERLNSLPKEQQAFLKHYLTPETAALMGIVGGQEAYNYFKQYTDPNKMAIIVPRNLIQGGGQDQQQPNSDTSNGNSAETTPVDKEVESVEQTSKSPEE